MKYYEIHNRKVRIFEDGTIHAYDVNVLRRLNMITKRYMESPNVRYIFQEGEEGIFFFSQIEHIEDKHALLGILSTETKLGLVG